METSPLAAPAPDGAPAASAASAAPVLCTLADGVATITLNQPDRKSVV